MPLDEVFGSGPTTGPAVLKLHRTLQDNALAGGVELDDAALEASVDAAIGVHTQRGVSVEARARTAKLSEELGGRSAQSLL